MTALWERFKPQGDSEAQTEADWIRPVLEALGHHYNVQVGMQTPLGAKVPDYVSTPTTRRGRRRSEACSAKADFSGALAIGDAKAWERRWIAPAAGTRERSTTPASDRHLHPPQRAAVGHPDQRAGTGACTTRAPRRSWTCTTRLTCPA